MTMRVLALILLVLSLFAGGMAQAQQRWQQLPLLEPYGDIDALLQLSSLRPAPWKWTTGESPNPGFTSNGYWFRTTLSLATTTHQVLWIRNGIYTTLDVYLVRNGVMRWHRQGGQPATRSLFDDVIPIDHAGMQPLDRAIESAPAALMSNEAELYVRATPAGVLQLQAQLVDEHELLSLKERQDFALGALLGVMLILAAYFGVLYLIVRDRGFLYYVLNSAATTLLIAFWHGFDRAPWWPALITPAPTLMLIMSQLVIAGMLTLTLWFLRLQYSEDTIARALRLLRNAALLLALATPALPQVFVVVCNVLCGTLLCVGVSSALIRYGNFRELSVRLFMLGWICFLPSATVMSLHRLGFMDLDMTVEIMANGGWVLEMVLQAFALAVRYDVDQREKLAAQQQAIAARVRESAARSQALHSEQQARRAVDEAAQAQRDYSATLELRVQQRRAELERVQQELAAISVTDALTGLHNRRFFTERFEQEVLRMRQLHAGLSLMLIDVDHFKRINDSYGHLAGDECLQQVAARLKSQLKRPSDVLCRYGGEEFAVLLPDTPLPGALAFAHAIREAVAATPMQCEGVAVATTISVGLLVATAGALEEANFNAAVFAEKLLHRTDQALYQAKKEGRNCVRVAD